MDPASGEEMTGSFIDTERNVIWRKAARFEPIRLVRALQAIASRLHPAIRLPVVNVVFPPGSVDYESHPYHIGWILHAWPSNREKKSVMQSSTPNKTRSLKA